MRRKENIALAKINAAVALNRIASPFDNLPIPISKCTSIALGEKSKKGQYRLLHKLSYPYDENSINLSIPEEHKTVKYATIRDAVKLLNAYDQPFMAMSDIQYAFRLIFLAPEDYCLTGFTLKGKYYFDRCLPMGASSSCNIFERFSDALVYILRESYGVNNVVKILDDFMFIEPSRRMFQSALDSFLSLAKLLGVPLSEKKTVLPTTAITFLGV